jgi:hypothetical protein
VGRASVQPTTNYQKIWYIVGEFRRMRLKMPSNFMTLRTVGSSTGNN